MPINIRDAGIRKTFVGMLDDNRITKGEVDKLIGSAKDGTGLSKTERRDLENILKQAGDKFDADAKSALEGFLGISTPTPPPVTPPVVNISSKYAAGITDAKQIPDTFAREMRERSGELSKPEDAFKVFAEYGGKLKALAATATDPRAIDDIANKLLDAGRNSPARGYDAKDSDFDTRSDLWEAARGRDPNKFDVRDEETGKIWTTTYWPMGGRGDMDQAGDPNSNLWAKKGPLAKIDDLLKARGMTNDAKALEFERKPALSWLIGSRDSGQFIPQSRLSEADAEMTTGIDFDGDGKLTPGVKVDFLSGDKFAAVANRDQLVPKATINGQVVEVRRDRLTDAQGGISFKFFNKADGKELTPDQLKSVFYSNPVSGDGKVDGTMDVSWWGSCDKVALAGILFKEPLKPSVTIDGVTFTKQDMLGLLTVIADSQTSNTDFVGARYDKNPDILVLKDGTQLRGKFEGVDDEVFRNATGMWRWEGDFMVITDPFKDDPNKSFNFRNLDGTTRTVKSSEIRNMAREDASDMPALEFHNTILKWLSDGRPAVMDRDRGDHVWNYNFHGATLKSATELTGTQRPTKGGYNGPVAADSKIVQYDMDVRLGDTNVPTNYRYWVEMDKTGKPVNSGWLSDNPDFLWRPADFKNFTGPNPRNPFVKPELVKQIYDEFMKP